MNEIITPSTIQLNSLAVIDEQPLSKNPAAVYLAGQQKNSERVHSQNLGVVADILSPGMIIPPERPAYPGPKATPDEREAYQAAKAKYSQERKIYDHRALLIPWGNLRYEHTAAVRARLLESGKSAATIRGVLTSLRGVLKSAWRLGQMTADDYTRAIDLDSVIGSTLPAGRGLTPGEIAGLMQACENDTTPAGARDAAIIALMYTCGLRREEVVTLSLASYDSETGELHIVGKRDKERLAYLVNGAADAMSDWLNLRGSAGDPLFVAINKGGKLDPGKALTSQAIYNLLAKRGAEASIKHFSPHDLRRSFVSDQLEAGADISTVAAMAGHASVTTTARYDRRGEVAKRKAAGLLHIPYRRRMV